MMKIKIVGLTGQTGAGKSSVSRIISSRRIEVIDCDEVSRYVVDNEKSCVADLSLEFGIQILDVNGSLNRKKLGSIVFGDKEKLSKLNLLILPYICDEVFKRVKRLDEKNVPLVVLDAPTLFESGIEKSCDFVVSVIAPLQLRLNRIIVRDHLTDDEARRRIASQHEDEFYTGRSDYVIVNDGDLHDLHLKTLEMINLMLSKLTPEEDCV